MTKKQLIIRSLGILLVVYVFVYRNTPSKETDSKKEHTTSTCNQKYLILENTSLDYILKMIKQYGGLLGDTTNQAEYNFKIGQINQWFVIESDSSLGSYEYYNLQSWFYGFEENTETPSFTMGFYKGNKTDNKSYFFYTDLEKTASDVAVGVYSTNENFTIYLPEGYEEHALKINKEKALNFSEIKNELKNNGLDIAKLKEIEFKNYKIKINKSS